MGINTKITITKADITQMNVDAIVNAANNALKGGGGVDGAIHAAGGPEIMEECQQIVEKQGECPTGEAVITGAGKLPAKHVIHTVGPVWHGGKQREPELLHSCYQRSLKVGMSHDCNTIAFPNISTGIFGYPKELAADVAIRAVLDFLTQYPDAFDEISFVCFDDENYNLYKSKLESKLR